MKRLNSITKTHKIETEHKKNSIPKYPDRNFSIKWLKLIIIAIIPVFILLGRVFIFHEDNSPYRPNILLICIDTLRADYLSCYNEVKYPTPNIDQLATGGILFENCISPIPITLPAHFSIFYSMLPHEEKVYNNGNVVLTRKTSLSEMLKIEDERIQTAVIISLAVLKERFGLNRGFDYYGDYFAPEKGLWYRRANEITDEGLKWLENWRNSESPFLLFLHYSDPHEPYSPPNMSPDLELFLNGKLLEKVVLSSGKRYQFLLKLPPGKNEVSFISLDDNGQPFDPSTKISPCTLNFLSFKPLNNISVKYHNLNSADLPKKNKIYLGNPAMVRVTNNSQQEENILLSFSGRHAYNVPEIKDLYGQEVQFCDKEIGRLIDKIKQWGLLDNLVIILISDHGEGLGQHNLIGHIQQLYDSLLKVPCIIYSPLLKKKGVKVTQQISLLDIPPTILNLWNIEIPEWMQGKPLLNKKLNLLQDSKERIIFSETFTPQAEATKFSLRTNNFKLIYTPVRKKWELYDIEHDIAENHNLYEKNKENGQIIQLKSFLYKRFSSLLGKSEKIVQEKLDKETLEILKSLGYVH